MAKSASIFKHLSQLSVRDFDVVMIATARRRYSQAELRAVGREEKEKAVKQQEKEKEKEKEKENGRVRQSSWMPDPITGCYIPEEDPCGESDNIIRSNSIPFRPQS